MTTRSAEDSFSRTQGDLARQIEKRTAELLNLNARLEEEVAQRTRAQEALQASEELHRVVLTNMSDAVFITDSAGAFTYVCPNAHIIFNYSSDQIMSLGNITMLLGTRPYDDAALRENGEIPNIDLEITDRTGGRRALLVNVKQVSINGGEVLYTCRDITERKSNEQRLVQLGAVVECSDDAIISMTLDGYILSWNAGAETIYGYSTEEVKGCSVLLIVPPDRFDEIPVILQKVKSGERVARFETERVRKDGTRISISLTMSPVRDLSGTIIAASAIGHDITEHKQFEEERLRLAHEEAANQAKDEFLSAVSHELRTPLTTIKMLTRVMLRNGLTDDERREYLETIGAECDRQIDLVLNLLDLSRIEAGVLNLEPSRVDVAEVVQACLTIERHAAVYRRHTLDADLRVEPQPVRADRAVLRRTLCGLIENAIKYTPDGGHIKVAADRAGDEVLISVADNGPGIAPADLPHIFKKFYRANSAGTSTCSAAAAPAVDRAEAPGIGLGLYLARKNIEQLSGRITVDSLPGHGATFTVFLPVWRPGEDVS